ncbi:MAG TPA: TIGR02391 family protein [Caldithrix abyssi]|uniref:TIGR02391 family protein n=1 Tax=Caldithrix abyssi TaxID=187145 RepID=A0A7V1PTB7_CALAY|nr:TIGR02391 family protein [Caldithrix abyssi]
MIRWYLSVKNVMRAIEQKARDALPLYEQGGKGAVAAIKGYMETDYERLWDLWCQQFPDKNLGNLGRHIHFGMDCDFIEIINHDIPELEKRAEAYLLNSAGKQEQKYLGFEELLHPVILENAYQLYRNGHLREAVLNSITAVYDLIRSKTGSEEDGDRLIGQVMSPNNPRIMLSELDTESGQNDQKGFMQIYKGAYQGIRNPKAHSLTHDLTELKAAQYLVFASLLARRIDEATILKA